MLPSPRLPQLPDLGWGGGEAHPAQRTLLRQAGSWTGPWALELSVPKVRPQVTLLETLHKSRQVLFTSPSLEGDHLWAWRRPSCSSRSAVGFLSGAWRLMSCSSAVDTHAVLCLPFWMVCCAVQQASCAP